MRTGRPRRDDGKNVRYGKDRERRSERRRETKGFRKKEEGQSRMRGDFGEEGPVEQT